MKKVWNTPTLLVHGSVNQITQQVTVTCPTSHKEFGGADGFKVGEISIQCAS